MGRKNLLRESYKKPTISIELLPLIHINNIFHHHNLDQSQGLKK